MIRATLSDRPAIDAFLQANQTIAMFPRSNLRDHGMDGGHPYAMTFWMRRDGGVVTDVLGLTDSGVVLPVFTSTDVPVPMLRGIPIQGIIGQAGPVAQIKAALGLPDAPLNRVEPHFELVLDDLQLPDVADFTIVPTVTMDRALMVAWRTQYGIEALAQQPDEAAAQATEIIDKINAKDSHVVLLHHGEPVAMAGFNTVFPEVVMVGGVFTPAHLRGRGYAWRAVAMQLAQARAGGVQRAVLSAANVAAAKAYATIGFRQVGEFMIVFYDKPEVSHG